MSSPRHYPSMDGATRDKLLARRIDPEASTTAFLDAVRSDFPLDTLLRNMTTGRLVRTPPLRGLPLAMVLSEDQRAGFLVSRESRYTKPHTGSR